MNALEGRQLTLVLVAAAFLVVISPLPAHADHSININTADTEALVTLTGVGEVRAQDIITYREVNDPFAKIEDIENVSGIGPATFDNIKHHIIVETAQQEPGEQDQSQQTENETESDAKIPTQTSVLPSPVPPTTAVYAHAEGERVVTVGAEVEFTAKADTEDGTPVSNAYFRWNFGDGSIQDGVNVTHRFRYPGTYVVVLDVLYRDSTVPDHFIVEARPAEIGVEIMDDGAIALTNRSGRDIDLSSWQLNMGIASYTFPKYTVILEDATVIFPIHSTKLNVMDGPAQLLFPNGEVAADSSANTASDSQEEPSKEDKKAGAQSDTVATKQPQTTSTEGTYAPLIDPGPSYQSSAAADYFANAPAITPEEATMLYGEEAAIGQSALSGASLEKEIIHVNAEDSSNGMLLWGGALALSVTALTAAAVHRRIRRREEDL